MPCMKAATWNGFRGVLFRVSSMKPLPYPDLATVALRVPRCVICLVSALAFHGMTTQMSPHGEHRSPKRCHYANAGEITLSTIDRFSPPIFEAGVETHPLNVPTRKGRLASGTGNAWDGGSAPKAYRDGEDRCSRLETSENRQCATSRLSGYQGRKSHSGSPGSTVAGKNQGILADRSWGGSSCYGRKPLPTPGRNLRHQPVPQIFKDILTDPGGSRRPCL